jgi:hypothetical protein
MTHVYLRQSDLDSMKIIQEECGKKLVQKTSLAVTEGGTSSELSYVQGQIVHDVLGLHVVSGAPPLPPLSLPAKEQPEPSPAPPPVAPEPQPTPPLPSEQLHQLLEAHADDLDDPRPGDPFAGFPADT